MLELRTTRSDFGPSAAHVTAKNHLPSFRILLVLTSHIRAHDAAGKVEYEAGVHDQLNAWHLIGFGFFATAVGVIESKQLASDPHECYLGLR